MIYGKMCVYPALLITKATGTLRYIILWNCMIPGLQICNIPDSHPNQTCNMSELMLLLLPRLLVEGSVLTMGGSGSIRMNSATLTATCDNHAVGCISLTPNAKFDSQIGPTCFPPKLMWQGCDCLPPIHCGNGGPPKWSGQCRTHRCLDELRKRQAGAAVRGEQ